MSVDPNKYAYRVQWSEPDKEYVGLCAEFPSISWLDSSPDKCLKGIRKAVHDCVDDMKENQEEIPPAIATRVYSGKFMVRVPPEVHRLLALQAAESGVSLNRLASAKLAK